MQDILSHIALYFPADDWEYLLRAVVAGMLTAAIGYERERAGKVAGLRTHTTVGITSSLFVSIGHLAIHQYDGPPDTMQVDPIRMVQAIAIGIGFLGSGIVWMLREGGHTRGLTTAATIWATAAIGVAAGFGHFLLAGGVSLLILFVLRVMSRFDLRETKDESKAD